MRMLIPSWCRRILTAILLLELNVSRALAAPISSSVAGTTVVPVGTTTSDSFQNTSGSTEQSQETSSTTANTSTISSRSTLTSYPSTSSIDVASSSGTIGLSTMTTLVFMTSSMSDTFSSTGVASTTKTMTTKTTMTTTAAVSSFWTTLTTSAGMETVSTGSGKVVKGVSSGSRELASDRPSRTIERVSKSKPTRTIVPDIKTKSVKSGNQSMRKPTSIVRQTRTRATKLTPKHTTKPKPTRSTRHPTTTPTKLALSRTTVSHSSKVHISKSHSSHGALPTGLVRHNQPHGPKGGLDVVADPVPGSAWERIRKILLIPLCTMTVLTFSSGVALYIAATWGSGEGWFGRRLVSEIGEEMRDEKAAMKAEEGRTIGSQPEKEVVTDTGKVDEEKGKRASGSEFQFRVPSLDGVLKQS